MGLYRHPPKKAERSAFERNPGEADSYKLKKIVSGRQSISVSKIRAEKLLLKMEII